MNTEIDDRHAPLHRRHRRSARHRIVAAMGAAILLLGACGLGSDDEPRAIDSDNTPDDFDADTTTGTDPDDTTATSTSVEVYFLHTADGRNLLAPIDRKVPRVTPRNVLEALFAQTPNDSERFSGYSTAIPSSTSLVSSPELSANGVLVVDLSKNIFEVQGETLRNAFGQVVCTLTGIEAVDAVLFKVEGEPTAVPAVDGRQTDAPVRCSAYSNLIEDDLPDPDATGQPKNTDATS